MFQLLQRFDELLAQGVAVKREYREVGVITTSNYKWRQNWYGINVDDAKEAKELRVEDAKLKRLAADSELGRLRLQGIARGRI